MLLKKNVVNYFANSAIDVLKIRVINSPPERGEQRWLKGWERRVKTYESI
jgi:hypothetical protein